MDIGITALIVIVIVAIIVVVVARIEDPKDIEDEEASAVEKETPHQRQSYLEDASRDTQITEMSKTDPGDTGADTNDSSGS